MSLDTGVGLSDMEMRCPSIFSPVEWMVVFYLARFPAGLKPQTSKLTRKGEDVCNQARFEDAIGIFPEFIDGRLVQKPGCAVFELSIPFCGSSGVHLGDLLCVAGVAWVLTWKQVGLEVSEGGEFTGCDGPGCNDVLNVREAQP